MKTRVVLGSECDEALRTSLFECLRSLGAETVAEDSGHAGSQAIETIRVRVAGADLRIESETYAGLSLVGDAALVQRVVTRLRELTTDRRGP